MIKRLFALAVLALSLMSTAVNALDIPIPDCSPENCSDDPPRS